VSLAHNGVLFLDELPEFKKNVLEVPRHPLEDGHVTISRAESSVVTWPASLKLRGNGEGLTCIWFFLLQVRLIMVFRGFFRQPPRKIGDDPVQVNPKWMAKTFDFLMGTG